MALYKLILESTGDIVTVFDWDGIQPLLIPDGYTTSSYTDGIISTQYESFDEQIGGSFYGNFFIEGVPINQNFNSVTSSFTVTNIAKQLGVTGSVFVSGSVYVNNTPLATIPTNYGGLFFNTGSNLDVNPPFASFRFNTNPHDWQQPVTRITMDIWNALWVGGHDGVTYATPIAQKYGLTQLSYDEIDKWYNYVFKLFDVVNKGLTDTVLTLKSADFPTTYKKFKIKGGTVYTEFDYENTRSKKINWGDKLLTMSGQNGWIDWNNWNDVPINNRVNNPSMFTNSNYYSESLNMYPDYVLAREFDNNDPISQRQFGLTYFDLNVEEVESSFEWYEERFFSNRVTPVSSSVEPKHCTDGIDETQNDLFWIDFVDVSPIKRKIIHFVTSSTNITVPDWTEEITTICIGAGGGGGGGASGFAHSESIQYEQKIRDNENDVNGSPGSYTPGSNKPFGHEFVTGGGGGAGGCVAITTVKGNFVKNNRGNPLSITVGSPGTGGLGSSYFNDVVATKYKLSQNSAENDRWKILLNTEYLFKVTMGFPISPIKPKQFDSVGAFDVDTPFYPLYSGITTMSPSGNQYNGKPGGATFVELGSRILASAQGGNGGTGGISIRDSAEPFHLMCGSPEHSPALVMVPGGANEEMSLTNVGQDIRIGGPGGYGISMPTPKQTITLRQPHKQDSYIDELWEHTIKANNAIDIPWTKDTSLGDANANNVFPIGNTVRGNVSNADLYLKYNSNGYDVPTKPAPTGGGGGCGVLWSGLDRRDASIYSANYVKHNTIVHRYGIPNDWFEVLADLITGSISLGLGGTNTITEYLINEADETGKIFSLQLNSTGSHGGYGKYGIATDNNLSPNNIVYEDLQPQPGQDFGYGGGGGAGRYVLNHSDKFRTDDESLYPTKGQDGADGGRGLAIIIFE